MTPLPLRITAALALVLLAAGARAEPVRVAFEPGIDQEVAAALAVGGAEPLVLQRRFLEPRKARLDPGRAANDSLQLLNVHNGGTASLLSYKADAPLWVGPAQAAAEGAAFAVRAGGDAAAVYRATGRERAVAAAAAPWERKGATAPARAYERVFLIGDGAIGVYAEVGVYKAEAWLGSATGPVALDTFIQNGDGRVIAVDDVAEVDGRVLLLLTVASGRGNAQAEIWLLSFDRSFQRASARAMRLETGTMASGNAGFVRGAQGPAAVRVTQRESTQGRPTLKLFPLAGGIAFWTRELSRLVGADDVAFTAVCRRSFLMLRGAPDDKGHTRIAEWVLVGPAGQEAVLEQQTMPEGTLLTRMVAAADKDKVWSYLNFTRFESTRRTDGWYSWRGYQVNAEPQSRHCRFE